MSGVLDEVVLGALAARPFIFGTCIKPSPAQAVQLLSTSDGPVSFVTEQTHQLSLGDSLSIDPLKTALDGLL